jgi:hypothetical protein
MNGRQDYLEQFFETLRLEAFIVRRQHTDLIFVRKDALFEHHRRYLQRWFVILKEDEKFTVLRERLRGTDQTAH